MEENIMKILDIRFLKKFFILFFSLILMLSIVSMDINIVFAADARSIINSAKLGAPMKTGYTDIDNKIAELIKEGKAKTKDRYALVKWLYERCVYKNSYGYAYRENSYMENKIYGYVPPFPDWLVSEAVGPLFYNKGVCDSYAAEFVLITRALGFESYYFSGQTRRAQNAGFTGHAWCEIKINGVNYIFDTQVEDNVTESLGEMTYLYFCKTESEMKDRYVWDWNSINKNMKNIGSEATLKSLENYLVGKDGKTIRVKNFDELKKAVLTITQEGINNVQYYIILDGEMDRNLVSEYLKNNAVSKNYYISNMPKIMRDRYIKGNYESVSAKCAYEMFDNVSGVDVIGIGVEFTPQENLYIYGEKSLADDLVIPDINKIDSKKDAIDSVSEIVNDLSDEYKNDGDVLDITALYAEEAAARANTVDCDEYSVDADDFDNALNCDISDIKGALRDENVSLRRNVVTGLNINMPDDKRIVVSASSGKNKFGRIRCNTSYASIIVPNENSLSVSMEKKGNNKVYVNFENNSQNNVVKVSFPGITDSGKNFTVADDEGNLIGGKYNPITKELEAKINKSGIYSIVDNAKSFSDIKTKSAEVQNAVELLAAKGIINGTSAAEFSPDDTITRAEITSLICRIISKYDANADGGFSDVTPQNWYFGAAGSGKKIGIINGYANNTFRGSYVIPKIQIVSIAARVLKTEMGYLPCDNSYEVLSEFSDYSDIADWGKNDAALANMANMIVKRKDGAFLPNEEMTRGDAAVILKRLYDKVW